MFKRKLLNIQRAIDEKKDIDLLDLVEHRLNKTFCLYVQELEVSYNRLLRKKDITVLKRYAKEEDNGNY